MMGTAAYGKQIKRSVSRSLAYVLICAVISLNYGCGSQGQALSIETHLDLHTRKIALVPATNPIKSSLNVPAKGWKEGFVFGAKQAAVDTTRVFVEGGHCEGEICGFVVLVYLSALATGVTIGSVYEAMTAPSVESVKTMEKGLIDIVGATFTQKTFAEMVKKNASENPDLDMDMMVLEGEQSEIGQPDFDALRASGFQQVIIVRLSDITFFAEKGNNPPLNMSMVAVAEIVDLDQTNRKNLEDLPLPGPEGELR